MYRKSEAMLMESSGNALGTRYVPCRAAASGLFAPSACCAPGARECMYTFAADAVTAQPLPSPPLPHTADADNVIYTLRGSRILPPSIFRRRWDDDDGDGDGDGDKTPAEATPPLLSFRTSR
jgi:hypothetical protein